MVSETKERLIKIGFSKNTEMAYVPEDIFNKLMAKGHVRHDGVWISKPILWNFFFAGWAMHKAGKL